VRTAFFVWPAGWASGHDAFQGSFLQGLLEQDRHEIVVVVEDRFADFDVPTPHRLATYRRAAPRWARGLIRDVVTESAAGRVVLDAQVGALIANVNFPIPAAPGVPLLAMLHETDFMEPAPWHWFSPRFLQGMTEVTVRGLRNASAVFANSAYTAARACREFNIPMERGLRTAPAVRPFGASLTESEMAPYVAQVGWFHPRKNLPLVLDAWATARRRGLPHDLVLIGRPGPGDHVHGTLGRQILDHAGALAPHVHITGLVSREEYGGLLANASALLVGSYQEGFCVPVIEAFSLGTPVVAVARTALVEVAGPCGLLVEPEVDAFAEGILRAVSEPPNIAAMQAYAARFTPANQIAPALAVLDDLEAVA
jgi:glycosyltransferase involved in cell wall biosynthesis